MFRAQLGEEPPPILLNFRVFCLRGEAKVKTGSGSTTNSATAEAERMQNPWNTGKGRTLDPFQSTAGYELVILSNQTHNIPHPYKVRVRGVGVYLQSTPWFAKVQARTDKERAAGP